MRQLRFERQLVIPRDQPLPVGRGRRADALPLRPALPGYISEHLRETARSPRPYPYVLYSDLYEHRQFIRGVAQSSFSGLLWTPEVRDASGPVELVRRMQAVALSPLAMVNGWYLKNAPWKQVERDANNAGRFADNWQRVEAQCRAVIELRMRLIPYLHAAFVRYHREGLPPFRALLMDYPDDPELRTLDDQYMMGDSVLVAPVIVGRDRRGAGGDARAAARADGEARRSVYLPEGEWFDYWSGKRHTGKQRMSVSVPLEQIPVFVKAGALLPLAQVTLHTDDPASWRLTSLVYGDGSAAASLYEEDGGIAPAIMEVRLSWDAGRRAGSIKRSGAKAGQGYEVIEWKIITT